MTTNERLNASRYTHFHRPSKRSSWLRRSKFNSPFDRGCCQNTADFFHLRLGRAGLQSRDIDWKNEFNMNKWLNDEEEEENLIKKDGTDNIV